MPRRKNWVDIKKDIKENQDFIWWVDMKGKIIFSGRESEPLEKKMLKEKDGEYYKLYLSFHTGKKFGQGGVLAINVRSYNKEGKKLTNIRDDRNGRYWVKQRQLENRNWSMVFLNQVIRKITKKGFEFELGIHNLQ